MCWLKVSLFGISFFVKCLYQILEWKSPPPHTHTHTYTATHTVLKKGALFITLITMSCLPFTLKRTQHSQNIHNDTQWPDVTALVILLWTKNFWSWKRNKLLVNHSMSMFVSSTHHTWYILHLWLNFAHLLYWTCMSKNLKSEILIKKMHKT
jgi:hypothetical protein